MAALAHGHAPRTTRVRDKPLNRTRVAIAGAGRVLSREAPDRVARQLVRHFGHDATR
jgi:hypothetical protein